MAAKITFRKSKSFFSNFLRTTFYLKFKCAQYQLLGPRTKNRINRTVFFSLKSLSSYVSVTFSTLCVAKLAKDPAKPEIFGNLSNFEELYLRAQ